MPSPRQTLCLTKKQADSFFCLVMPLGHRNIFVALTPEKFAGTNFEEIRHEYTQLVRCTAHMHQKGIIHATYRSAYRRSSIWMQLAASEKTFVGLKSSSAFIAPELIYADKDSKTVLVKRGKYVSSGVIGVDDLVVASPAVDV